VKKAWRGKLREFKNFLRKTFGGGYGPELAKGNVKQHTVANAATSDISQNLIQTPKSTSMQNLIRKSNQSYTPLILFQIPTANATDDLHSNS